MGFINSLPSVFAQGFLWSIMAIGVYFTYKVLDFSDLTVDGSLVTGSAVCVMAIGAGVPVWIAIILAFVSGLLCGLCTGLLHTVLGIAPILSGILTQLGLYSVNLAIMEYKASVWLTGADGAVVSTPITLGLPLQTLWIMALIVTAIIGLLYWFFGTQLGCSIRATGCNESMARAQGINTKKTKVLGLMISNGLVALCGAFLTLYNGSANITRGTGAIVVGLAAVIIGGVIVSKLPNNFAIKMAGVVLGAIVYYFVFNLVIFVGLNPNLLQLFSAVVVAIFLAAPHFKKKFTKVKINKDELPLEGGNNA